ncbi:DUF2459 domain-containing protein [Roseibium salinum]|nr:DUF2459 domain-containing protein [Roseibium salinum]
MTATIFFFPAKGGFNAFAGCNVWTARMLREAGLRTGGLDIFASDAELVASVA